jgi:hypothetical protein
MMLSRKNMKIRPSATSIAGDAVRSGMERASTAGQTPVKSA